MAVGCKSGEPELRAYLEAALARRAIAQAAVAAAAAAEATAREQRASEGALEKAASASKSAEEELTNAAYEVYAASKALATVLSNIAEAAHDKAGGASLVLAKVLLDDDEAPFGAKEAAAKAAAAATEEALAKEEIAKETEAEADAAFWIYAAAEAKSPSTMRAFMMNFAATYPEAYKLMLDDGWNSVFCGPLARHIVIGRQLSAKTIVLTAEALHRQMMKDHPSPLTVLQVYEILCKNLGRDPQKPDAYGPFVHDANPETYGRFLYNPKDPNGPFVINPTDPNGRFLQYPSDPSGRFMHYPNDPNGRFLRYPSDPNGRFLYTPLDPNGHFLRTPVDPNGHFLRTPVDPNGHFVHPPVDPNGLHSLYSGKIILPEGSDIISSPAIFIPAPPVRHDEKAKGSFNLYKWARRLTISAAVNKIRQIYEDCEKFMGDTPPPYKEFLDFFQ